ncbi:MAG: sulfatase [Gemmataceae bacterium]
MLALLLLLPLADAPKKPNVLFIAVDDLNHWVGHLARHPQTKTPNLDRLAKRGVTFTRAYCAAPLCNPSRASLMSGLRPGQTGVYLNPQDWRPHVSKDKTLTSQFLKAGYGVFGSGKIYHSNVHRPGEWTEYFEKPGRDPAGDGGVGGIRFAPLDCADGDLVDARNVGYGVAQLGKKHDKPFFLAVGLHKPHMPWNVPKKYYDLFPLDRIELPPVKDDDLSDVPPAGVKMARPGGDHAAMVKSGRWKEAVQAYLAAVAYADGQIGRLIDALDASPHKADTVVVLWGDHGWHLGEKQHWRKFSLWEEGTRTPLIWVAPGVKPAACATPVDLMSVYPTVCDLCGVPVPKHVTAPSLRPLLADAKAKWDHPAVTTFGRNNHAVRTARWRYIRYADGGEELYDHGADEYEWTNLAGDPKLAAVKKELAGMLPEENAAGVASKKE